jgi:hypothetical protein
MNKIKVWWRDISYMLYYNNEVSKALILMEDEEKKSLYDCIDKKAIEMLNEYLNVAVGLGLDKIQDVQQAFRNAYKIIEVDLFFLEATGNTINTRVSIDLYNKEYNEHIQAKRIA